MKKNSLNVLVVICTSCNAIQSVPIVEGQKLYPFKCEECGILNVNTRKDDSMDKHCETCTCKTPKAGEFWRLKNGNWIMMEGDGWAIEYDNDNKYVRSGLTRGYEVTERLFLNNFEM